jgi:hypothetical protein
VATAATATAAAARTSKTTPRTAAGGKTDNDDDADDKEQEKGKESAASATARCNFCLAQLQSATAKACGGCTGHVCSRACQVADWKLPRNGGKGQAHKLWCPGGCAKNKHNKQPCGEEGTDWEIRCADAAAAAAADDDAKHHPHETTTTTMTTTTQKKGLGVFALRNFARFERIMVERAFSLRELHTDKVPTRRAAVAQLMPLTTKGNGDGDDDGDDDDKAAALQARFKLNCMGTLTPGLSVVCVRMSRVNHACAPNAAHTYESVSKAVILVALRAIRAGDEITFAYSDVLSSSTDSATRSVPDHVAKLRLTWNIVCPAHCACRDKRMHALTLQAKRLDWIGLRAVKAGLVQRALDAANELLELQRTVLMSPPNDVNRTLHDAFQAAVSTQATLTAQAPAFGKRLVALNSRIWGAHSADAAKYARLALDPSSHPAYLMNERRGGRRFRRHCARYY